ncbi:uncharacterized protein LOC113376058 [Ctenocephalides felis]|uniref:uncharacterized protein LOC113376058 n=1 Tax=Ctenocephalides felis TaxID=7515 RepID=UPI000E6E3452|nr:uncharacterized protein LOC113376058 [Ctenocephalides felis]
MDNTKDRAARMEEESKDVKAKVEQSNDRAARLEDTKDKAARVEEAKDNAAKMEESKEEDLDLNNFDPMSDHYYSEDNCYLPGTCGHLYKKYIGKKEVKLFITNIPPRLKESGLRNVFSLCGNVLKTTLIRRETHAYGFVVYDNVMSALEAIRTLNRREPHNLKVKFDKNVDSF